MLKLTIFVLFGAVCLCLGQKQQYTTPVPILKQINRHNEDGSYSYGYEGADGSFKIETKSANGEVRGKYGYIDSDGKVREVEYGANQDGFQPTGTDINVAPAAPGNNPNSYPPLAAGEIDDGQYREDPNMYNDPRYNSKPSGGSKAQSNFRFSAPPARPAYQQPQQPSYQQQAQPAYQQQQYRPQQFRSPGVQQPVYQQEYEEPEIQTQRPFFQSRFTATPAPAANYYQPQQNYYRPSNNYYQHPDQVNIFQGHPATNLDLATGSYSVTYG
jgi:hypothetical protein